MANMTIGIRDGETYQDAQDRWDACSHEGKVVTDGANGWDPAWVIDWYCPKCGVSQSFDHKHEYVPTGEKFVFPISGKEYEGPEVYKVSVYFEYGWVARIFRLLDRRTC